MNHKLCFSCKKLRKIFYVDPIERGYCAECVITLPLGSVARAMQFLELTVPFTVGDRVHAYSGGECYDGIGYVAKVGFDMEHGTPFEPTFHVVVDEPADELAPAHANYLPVHLRTASHVEAR
ncbi:hypothetical protein A5790_16395 [Mycobacterium sp. 852002-51152_SCH6134967]|uniref:DUF7245 domain-containing zinc-binding protein n=1 Tax=Mycobacterium sp. 852002-51152_SCH6134967 TaxID=1834096 RepID=UPI0007FC9B4D|nr:hypothetical protein [Mycobacterium sp. 852002-51152_SCH6134967]OBF90794.1 hypothetical protein A5790_16395 [Mycobacterium sp. 852002-51152_SCH6134967]